MGVYLMSIVTATFRLATLTSFTETIRFAERSFSYNKEGVL